MALACHTGFNRFSQARATRRSAFHTTSMTRKNTLRWITIALGLVALGAVAKWQFFPAAQPPSFVTATATVTDLQDTVLASGTLQAFKQVSVGAQVSGQVKVLHVVLGDKVKAGQLIAEIDSVPQQNTQRNAEAALANVQAQLRAQQATQAQTALALQRQKELVAADAGARARTLERYLTMPPQEAARLILAGVAKGAPRVLVGADARRGDLLQRLRPATYWPAMKRALARAAR